MASKHIQIYEQYFGERICELTGAPHCQVHHLKCRGMGGSKKRDFIENLMGLCQDAHDFYGDKKQFTQWLTDFHLEYMDHRTPLYILRPDDPIFQEYLNHKYGSNIRL